MKIYIHVKSSDEWIQIIKLLSKDLYKYSYKSYITYDTVSKDIHCYDAIFNPLWKGIIQAGDILQQGLDTILFNIML